VVLLPLDDLIFDGGITNTVGDIRLHFGFFEKHVVIDHGQ
jgi:hypothetical protein